MANRRLVSNWYENGQDIDFLTLAKEGDILEVWNWLPFGGNQWGVLTTLTENTARTMITQKVTGQHSGIVLVSLQDFKNNQSYRINNSSDSRWPPGSQQQIVQSAMNSIGPNYTDLSSYNFAVKCRANLLRGNSAPRTRSSNPPPTLPKPSKNAVPVLPPFPKS